MKVNVITCCVKICRQEHSRSQEAYQLHDISKEFNELFTGCHKEIHGLGCKVQGSLNHLEILEFMVSDGIAAIENR